ncbi:MAG: PAS domain S-box protein [Fibrobacterales bacterium]
MPEQILQNEIELLLESAPDALLVLSESGAISHCNHAALKSLGYSEKALHALTISDLEGVVLGDRIFDTLTALLPGERCALKTSFVKGDGDRLPVEVNVSRPVRLLGCYYICCVRDISSYISAREELMRNERLGIDIEKLNKTGGWEYTLLTKEIYWTKGMYVIHEMPVDPSFDLIEESLQCYPSEYRKQVMESFNQLISSGVEFDFELPFTTFRKNRRWVRTKAEPVYENGVLTKVVGSLTDITERKELALRLEESTLRFQQIADNIDEIFWLIRVDGTVLMVNSAAERILEQPGTLGKDFWTLPFWKEEECDEVRKYCTLMLVNRIRHSTRETIWTKSSGAQCTFQHNISLVPDDAEGFAYFAITSQDISAHKEYEAREKVQQEQLRQADKMASLGILVSGVAHEINNPNNLVMLNATFLQKVWHDVIPVLDDAVAEDPDLRLNNLQYLQVRDKFAELLNSISMGSDRIKGIVHSLKEFVRVDTGRLDGRVLVNTVVKEAVMIVQNVVSKATDHFAVSYAPIEIAVKGNAQQLEQVVINLLTNACQALTQRPQSITVVIECDAEDAIISVIDEGCGMSPETMKKIKDPFFTTNRDHGGTGLGLSVSHTIVEAHNGMLHYESALGKGTRAYVRIPLVEKVEC